MVTACVSVETPLIYQSYPFLAVPPNHFMFTKTTTNTLSRYWLCTLIHSSR